MKYFLKALTLTCTLTLVVVAQDPAPAPPPKIDRAHQLKISQRDRSLRASQDAFADPFNKDKLIIYMSLLPRDGDLYVVEGDLLLTDQELQNYLVVKSQSERPVESSAELLVNVFNGQRDYYKDPAQRTLTYAVDRKSFPEEQMYLTTVANIDSAARSWETACVECNVKFSYVKAADSAPSTERVNFVLRYKDVGGSYIAAAFFPHDGPVRRFLNIDPSYFKTSFDKVGVLRHELGHVLGYRHEHIRGISGCFFEDNNWQPLTAYDPKSVMHYFCGDAGSLDLQLTEIDRVGHRKLYGAVTIGMTPKNLRIRFDGPDLSRNLPEVLETLSKLGVVEAKTYNVKTDGENLKAIYANTLRLPSALISNRFLSYATSFNKGSVDPKKLVTGQQVLYPDVKFKAFQKLVVLDPKIKKDLETYNQIWAKWPPSLINESKQESGSDAISLYLKSYELNVQVDSVQQDSEARAALSNLKKTTKANYLVLGVPAQSAPALLYSGGSYAVDASSSALPSLPGPSPDPTALPESRRQTQDSFYEMALDNPDNLEAGVEGDLSLALGELDELEFPEQCTTKCPQIILMDQPVFLHPDIADAIKEGGAGVRGTAPINNNKQLIRIQGGGDSIKKAQHGTYMAGIIASQQNRFGLIGVNPKAEIISVDWDAALTSPVDTADEIVQRGRDSDVSKRMQIYVFATEWKLSIAPRPQHPEDRFVDRLNNQTDSFLKVLASQLSSAKPLIITSAGQAESPTEQPKEISNTSAEGPRNMGDQRNVIVVTAYETTADGQRQLWPLANFQKIPNDKVVHVAAPGLLILSTIPNSGSPSSAPYGRASGTSQATAFVAGIASAMVGNWPGFYNTDAVLVKTRLQLTSDPFMEESNASRLAAGVVDYNLALHNPEKHWFKSNNDPKFVEVIAPKWLVSEIQLLDPHTLRSLGSPIRTRDIYRIMYRDDLCYIYAAGVKPGEIQKFGPGKFSNVVGKELLQLKRVPDGVLTPYTLSAFKDLLLANTIR